MKVGTGPSHVIGYLLATGASISYGASLVLAKQVVEGAISGIHRSPYKGVSIEFAQHRDYVHGDEIRRVD